MSIACWCVLAAAILPYLTIGVAKATSPYDNAKPRDADAYRGLAARANGAHFNGFEAFAFFAIAVLIASQGDPRVGVPLLDGLAVAWIIARLAYVAAYLGNRPTLRSSVWCVSFALAAAIFTMPAWHG